MTRLARASLFAIVFLLVRWPALSHDLPVSYIDLHVTEAGIEATIEASAKNYARELIDAAEDTLLLQPNAQKERLFALAVSRLKIDADGQELRPEFRGIEALPARNDLRLQLLFSATRPVKKITVRCSLFSSDQRHKTFLNIYQGEMLKYQDIFSKDSGPRDHILGSQQGTMDVIKQFVWEGVHHIFIGPDHILFVVGLLLLGGTLGQLLKIVTAFTIAHSVTLVLATLNILSPPARVIEPTIALSIVFVGAHALLHGSETRDWRLLFAFGFGFIHGFGFANVLRGMQLPREALGWSLFSFNAGVEIGQACIVLAVAPVLGILARRTPAVSRRAITAGAFCVIFAGAFWLTQRLSS